jgi:sugar phosphate isomerase/epimerase
MFSTAKAGSSHGYEKAGSSRRRAGVGSGCNAIPERQNMNIGLQLYSVRDALAADYAGTLEAVKNMGYAGVELFGNHLPAPEIKALLERLGLVAIAHHFVLQELEADFAACAERARAVGTNTVVCAWSMPSTEQPWEAILSALEQIAAKAKQAGFLFLYHNHEHEILQTVAGQRVMDAILERTDAEIDVAWVTAGNLDAVAYLEQYAQKAKLIHLKDVHADGEKWQTVELGQGHVPLEAILQVKTIAPWWVIEQDHSPDPMQSAKRNFVWLKQKLS